ncbi:unnamed protein product [Rotaria sp. Silwood1]|nr:unnamed protein product [Rotaria sp. Silwood1]
MTAVVEYYPSPGHIGNDLFLKDDIKDINEDSQAIEQIYSYWFGENINTWSKTYPLNTKLWFKVQEQVDREIKEKFEGLLIDAARPNSDLYQRWKKTDRGKLALIILLDQFSRNMYRGTAKMFEFDSLALSLALEITEDCTHIKSYSLPERLFIYLPLVHSENLVYTTKGADRLEQLASEVTQRDVRRRYATNARSARVHQQIIEMYGRYPHRNHLLGRQSTPEEEEYLKTARNGFVRSVQTIQCPSSSILMPPDTSSTYPSLKILVLHGFHQNSNSLKRSAKKLFRELKGIATFYFANAPLPYNPTGEVKEQLLAAFGDGNLPEISYQRQWWNASKDSKIYHHLDVSLHYLDKLFKSDGPFDGVFGFAQGAALGGILCGLQPFGNISFHFAILISGFASRAECHEHLMQPNAIKNISSLHIYGVNDVLITSDRTLKLAAAFENPIIVSHPGGHFTPNTWPTNNIKQFLLDQQQQLLHQSDGISSFVMAKDIARYMHPLSPTAMNNERQLKAEKGYAYLLYKRLISAVCQVLEKASPTFVNEQARSRNRKDRALRLTKEQREELLNAPPSTYITNPEPEPVVPCALEDLQPLFDHLTSNKSGPGDENQPVVFTRGTIMSGGRLDLCKQVVGPQGIQPLLNAMKNSDVVNRLLLGNNIVGLPGAQAISNYIRFNQDSHIDTWYIAGNNFDSECISLICNALVNDMKVKALWLKRNPILTSGVVHIAQMLRTNHYLQTLDLLNTGLLDEGCKILFDAFKVNRTLKHLYLDTNGLTVKSGRIIRLHFEENDNQLESLYLSCNAFGDGGTSEIAVGLKHDQHLKRLGLASNCIGPDGVRALVDALIAHPSLQQLNLGFMKATILLGGLDNVIGDEGAGEVSRLIRSNEYIRSIDLTFNGISQRGLMKLRDALRENRTLTTLKVLQFGQVHSEITKEEINMMLETNKIEWGRQVLSNIDGSSLTKADCLQKGQQLNEEINFPEHVMEIISYYRTH